MRIILSCFVLLLGACRPAPTESPRPARKAARTSVASDSAWTPPRVKTPRLPAKRPVARRTTSAGRFIPGTRILATPANQVVLAVVTRYRQALAAHSLKGLMALIHPKYHDGFGTPSPLDDVHYVDLARNLARLLGQILVMHVQMAVRSLRWRGRHRAWVTVDSTLDFRIRNSRGGKGPMRTKMDSHLIQLAKHKGKWLITSGM